MASDKRLRALIDKLLAAQEPAIRKAFLAAMNDARATMRLDAVVEALAAGDIGAATRALEIPPGMLAPVSQAVNNAYFEAGVAHTALLMADKPRGIDLEIRFDPGNPRAAGWLREHSSTLITEIVADQRAAVREALGVGMDAGRNPRAVALEIVGRMQDGKRTGGIIGLTSGQARAVENARAQLLAGPTLNTRTGEYDMEEMTKYFDRNLRDKRFDKTVRDAIRAGRPVAAPDVRKIIARYSDRMLLHRGEVVGRTEALTALSYAQNESVNQLMDASGFRPEQIVKTWRSRADGRTRKTHLAMNGQKKPLQEPFVSPSGARMRFPRDSSLGASAAETIQCRCYTTTKVDWNGAQQAAPAVPGAAEVIPIVRAPVVPPAPRPPVTGFGAPPRSTAAPTAPPAPRAGAVDPERRALADRVWTEHGASGATISSEDVALRKFVEAREGKGHLSSRVVSGDEFRAMEGPALFRGVANVDYVDSDIAGRRLGLGVSGNGNYFAYGRSAEQAMKYANGEKGWVYSAKLKPGARIIDEADLRALRPGDSGGGVDFWSDNGRVAAYHGYDAIRLAGEARHMVVVNVDSLVVNADGLRNAAGAATDDLQDLWREAFFAKQTARKGVEKATTEAEKLAALEAVAKAEADLAAVVARQKVGSDGQSWVDIAEAAGGTL